MALIVQKFGGTSVGSPERIRRVAARIAQSHAEGHQLVVVVSAMGHTTDELIELAHHVSEAPPHREMDMLLSAGERISMALLSMALSDCKIPALSLTGSQSGIITDQSHRRAKIRRILGDRIRNALQEGKVAIVAGFQGVSETKEITTLGRGGSDTTAVALAAALKADACDIFTDVDGVYSADPRIIPQAKHWKTIRHDLMVEMATRGAGVLHPRCVELAKQFNVPLRVRNSLNESEGTAVIATEKAMEDFSVTAVTADRQKLYLKVQLSRPTVLGAVWDLAAKSNLSVLTPVFFENEVRFFTDREAEEDWKRALDRLTLEGFVDHYQICSEYVPLSIIGNRFSQDGKALHHIIDKLNKENIPIVVGVASALSVTVGVPLARVDDGIKVLHQEFLEK